MVDILAFWNTVWPYLIAIFVFIAVIISHEFGHFIVAKLSGIRVNEFAVGFGPTLFKKKIGETVYALRLIPFGGFCAMEGEDDQSDDPRAFCKAKAWKRFLVVVAGATVNLLVGLILCASFVASQDLYATTVIAKFEDDAVSCKSGLAVGDKIVKADGRNIYTFNDFSYMLSTSRDGTIDFVVERDGERVTLDNVKFDLETYENGTRFISMDFYVYGEERTVLSVAKNAVKTEISLGRMVIMSVIDLIGGKFGLNDMSGPVGITVAISSAAKESLRSLLYITALISVNLGVFNLLPLPALDGGRLLFIIIEMIRRKPVPAKYENWVHAAGFALLMALSLFILANDIIKLF